MSNIELPRIDPVSVLRTLVPALWGVALAWLIGRIPAIQDVLDWLTDTLGTDVTALIGLAITSFVIAGYYWLARLIGRRWPALERWLVGSSSLPIYVERHPE